MHKSQLHMQDKTQAFSCVLTVMWPFSHVGTVDVMVPCYVSTSGTFFPIQILQIDKSWASALSNPNMIFHFNGLSVYSNV